MENLENEIYRYLKERGWDNLRPVDVTKSIMIEGAELLELFQWENLSLDDIKRDKKKLEEIKSELADVLIYAIELSVLLKFDTQGIVREKLVRSARKYPAKLMRIRKEEPGTESRYWRIKKRYRRP